MKKKPFVHNSASHSHIAYNSAVMVTWEKSVRLAFMPHFYWTVKSLCGSSIAMSAFASNKGVRFLESFFQEKPKT